MSKFGMQLWRQLSGAPSSTAEHDKKAKGKTPFIANIPSHPNIEMCGRYLSLYQASQSLRSATAPNSTAAAWDASFTPSTLLHALHIALYDIEETPPGQFSEEMPDTKRSIQVQVLSELQLNAIERLHEFDAAAAIGGTKGPNDLHTSNTESGKEEQAAFQKRRKELVMEVVGWSVAKWILSNAIKQKVAEKIVGSSAKGAPNTGSGGGKQHYTASVLAAKKKKKRGEGGECSCWIEDCAREVQSLLFREEDDEEEDMCDLSLCTIVLVAAFLWGGESDGGLQSNCSIKVVVDCPLLRILSQCSLHHQESFGPQPAAREQDMVVDVALAHPSFQEVVLHRRNSSKLSSEVSKSSHSDTDTFSETTGSEAEETLSLVRTRRGNREEAAAADELWYQQVIVPAEKYIAKVFASATEALEKNTLQKGSRDTRGTEGGEFQRNLIGCLHGLLITVFGVSRLIPNFIRDICAIQQLHPSSGGHFRTEQTLVWELFQGLRGAVLIKCIKKLMPLTPSSTPPDYLVPLASLGGEEQKKDQESNKVEDSEPQLEENLSLTTTILLKMCDMLLVMADSATKMSRALYCLCHTQLFAHHIAAARSTSKKLFSLAYETEWLRGRGQRYMGRGCNPRPRSFWEHAVPAIQAIEAVAAVHCERRQFNKSLEMISLGLAMLERISAQFIPGSWESQISMFPVQSPWGPQLHVVEADEIESWRAVFLGFSWKLLLLRNQRVQSATQFYYFAQQLKSTEIEYVRLCDAYAERAALLISVARGKWKKGTAVITSDSEGELEGSVDDLRTGGEEEEAISMLKAAIATAVNAEQLRTQEVSGQGHTHIHKLMREREFCSGLLQIRKAEAERLLAKTYISLAKKEGNKKNRAVMVHEALSYGYSALKEAMSVSSIPQQQVQPTTKPEDSAQELLNKKETPEEQEIAAYAAAKVQRGKLTRIAIAEALMLVGQFKKALCYLTPCEEKLQKIAGSFSFVDIEVQLLIARALSQIDFYPAQSRLVELRRVLSSFFETEEQHCSKQRNKPKPRATMGMSRLDEYAWRHHTSSTPMFSLPVEEEDEETEVATNSAKFLFFKEGKIHSEALLGAIAELLGDAHCAVGRWEQALSEFSQALSCFTLVGNRPKEAVVYGKLARAYHGLGQKTRVVTYLDQCQTLATEIGDELLCYEAKLQTAHALTDQREYERAAKAWSQLMDTAHEFEDYEVHKASMKNLISALQAQGMFSEAHQRASDLRKIAVAAGDAEDQCFALQVMAEALLKFGMPKQCLEVVEELEHIRDNVDDIKIVRLCDAIIPPSSTLHSFPGLTIAPPSPADKRVKKSAGQETKNLGDRIAHMAMAPFSSVNFPPSTIIRSGKVVVLSPTGDQPSSPTVVSALALARNLRAAALFGMRQDTAAISVLEELYNHSVADEDWKEAAKASNMLGNTISTGAPLEARKYFFQALDAGQRWLDALQINEDETFRQLLAANGGIIPPNFVFSSTDPANNKTVLRCVFDAARWLTHCFYLSREYVGVKPTPFSRQEDSLPKDDEEVPDSVSPLLPDEIVSTYFPAKALEVMELALRLASQQKCIPFSPLTPHDAVEKALHLDNITFVFYLSAEVNTGFEEDMRQRHNRRFDVIIHVAGSPFLDKISIENAAAYKYHRKRPSRQVADEPDDLYFTLRALHDSLWEPLTKVLTPALVAAKSATNSPVVIVPDPALSGIPFGSLVSSRKKCTAQRWSVIVAPTLEHFVGHLESDMRWPTCARVETTVLFRELQEHGSSATFANHANQLETTEGCRCLFDPTRKEFVRILTGDPGPSPQLKPSIFDYSDEEEEDNVPLGKHNVRSSLVSLDSVKLCVVLSDAGDDGKSVRMSDGKVHYNDIAAANMWSGQAAYDLLVMTADRSFQPSVSDPLGAVLLMCRNHCKRILRIDLAPGSVVTKQHEQVVSFVIQFLKVALENKLLFPFAAAIQAAQAEAIKLHMPPHVWGAFTLMGIP